MNIYAALSPDQTEVIGVFNMPQQSPLPAGYFGELDTTDPRVISFCATNGIVLPTTQPGE